jgi:hypothetical protein
MYNAFEITFQPKTSFKNGKFFNYIEGISVAWHFDAKRIRVSHNIIFF